MSITSRIEKYFPNKFKDIFVTNHPMWAKTGTALTKADICKKHNVDILIEDNLDYAKETVSEKTKVLLLDYKWNRGELPKGIKRMFSWQDIVEELT